MSMQLELPFLRCVPQPPSERPQGVSEGTPHAANGRPREAAPNPNEVQADWPGDEPRSRLEPRIDFIRERRARKYIIRIRPDGSLRVTIPRGGSKREADAFVARHRDWAERERLRVAAQHAPVEWLDGHTILLRGESTPLRIERDGNASVVVLASERVRVRQGATNLRPAAELALRRIAERELVPRLRELASIYGLVVRRVTIRNQRSRWGSCSVGGTIALNLRLVQMPAEIRDYVLLHELMHLKQQNHSRRYWRLVEEVCPDFRAAERWLRVHGKALF